MKAEMRQRLPKFREILYIGLGALVVSLVYWAVTGQGPEEPFFQTAAMTGGILGSYPIVARLRRQESGKQ
jgi:hypothetical protein